MYPFGLERFYGGLKLAISEGGLPVPEEWTRGEFVDDAILPYCIQAAQGQIVWCCFRTLTVPEFGKYTITNIRQVDRPTVRDCMMFEEKKVLFTIQSLDEEHVLDDIELDSLFISEQHLARHYVKYCMRRLGDAQKALSVRSMSNEDFLKAFRKFIGELVLSNEELTGVEQKLLVKGESHENT